jgi:hypothetical protein
MAEPPASAAAFADQCGSTYHFVDAANGLSTRPPLLELLLEDEELLLDELEELLDEELEDEELLLELEELEEELLLDELEELLLEDEELLLEELELLELEELPLIEPAETVSVTRSSLEPSSLLRIRSVCEPAARLLKVAGVMVP